eukprot:TRINITY_DN19806_c0_g1_i1.p1 TRINITY_DN19806_c0_g1~~TRINITY_DN19806_c0_g1_i1.p1  ORF type:complete len:271 (-),score=52.14 TRINITY_DN19806_c0_g1_i1:222-1034(-)
MASLIQRWRRCCFPKSAKSVKAMPMPSHPMGNPDFVVHPHLSLASDVGDLLTASKASDPVSFVAVRKPVPKDNSCLFRALAYLAEDDNDCSDAVVSRLREVCASNALADPDPMMRALLLGFDSVEEYAKWIRNDSHWGGESEVLVLANHYGIEVSVVCCRSLNVMCYGAADEACKKGRVYLFYTGEHYDPLVATSSSSKKAEEHHLARFPQGDSSFEAASLEFARSYLSDKAMQMVHCPRCGMKVNGEDHRCNGYHFQQRDYATKTGSMY